MVYAVQMGGVCTIIGTSTNIVVADLYESATGKTMNMFSIFIPGALCLLVGVVFIIAVRRWLPVRQAPEQAFEAATDYTVELLVPSDNPNICKTLGEAGLFHVKGGNLIAIRHFDHDPSYLSDDEFLMGGDRLVYAGQIDEILELKETHHLVASDHHIRSMNEINKNYELRIPSGQLTYCNAAHMPPLVQNPDRSVRCIKMIPNLPLGFDEKYKFVEEGCLLGKDEKLVLYTDGVTESRDATWKMMGGEKWREIVRHDDDLLGAVRQYIGEAEQTDDITLMTICKRSEVQPVSLHVPNHIDQWPLLRRTLHEYGVCIGIEKSALKKLEVALEEAVVNIVNYSQATEIGLIVQRDAPRPASPLDPSQNGRQSVVSITLTDNGVPFDPTSVETDPAKAIDELQIGGMGISLLRRIVDELHYERTNEWNQLTIIKYL
ncbi:MAG: SpoIIE family protein phosphatase [Prevotella sp.]|nr:SpoIIE family protein phosphatase [Prevotella sp.]